MVDHEILLKKLQIYHFSSSAVNWFRSYLSNRTQSVKLNSIISEELIIKTAVPQGSILGPLLFLLYVNDLHLHLTCSDLDMYADDSTLSVTDRSVAVTQNKVQSDLLKIEKWCVANNI